MRIAEEATTRRRARWSVAVSGIRKLRIASSVAVLSVQYGALFGPLVVWLLNRDDPYVEAQAKDALNFNISFFLYGLVAAISIIVLVGIFALPAVIVTWFVLVIAASVKAANGKNYRYPLTIQFVS